VLNTPNSKEHLIPVFQTVSELFWYNLFPAFQVIETLALEDTDIKSEHIAQIKELIQKEDTIEEKRSCQKTAEPTQ